ncbi:MAG TPA: hypothetical protein VJU86_07670 [Pyrinomonadaceae bacterium]|nr:hypothetical protein [Pyrinomonadaceae bacterium]
MTRRVNSLLLIGVAALAVFAVIMYSRPERVSTVKVGALSQAPSQQPKVVPTQTPAADSKSEKERCTFKISQAPDIFGLKLGSTLDQTLALFPGIKDDAEMSADLNRAPRLGMARFIVMPGRYGTKARFIGVRNITVGFLDGRLVDYNIGYEGPEFKNVDEFVATFSDANELAPTLDWQSHEGMPNAMKNLNCDGFQITLFAGGKEGNANYAQLKDLVAEKEYRGRQAKARAEAEKAAKP